MFFVHPALLIDPRVLCVMFRGTSTALLPSDHFSHLNISTRSPKSLQPRHWISYNQAILHSTFFNPTASHLDMNSIPIPPNQTRLLILPAPIPKEATIQQLPLHVLSEASLTKAPAQLTTLSVQAIRAMTICAVRGAWLSPSRFASAQDWRARPWQE